jgi:hypothetical protein
MPSAGFEPAIPTSERPQTHAVDRQLADSNKNHMLFIKLNNSSTPDIILHG